MSFEFWKELAITQICSSSISIICSTTNAAFILKRNKNNSYGEDGVTAARNDLSTVGLSSPYRRLIFGLSVADIIQSFAVMTGPFFTVKGTLQAPWGVGNVYTCRLGGVMLSIGLSAAPIYNLALCIYYMSKVKWKMVDSDFAHRIEKIIHVSIMALSLVYVVGLMLDIYHTSPLGSLCGIVTPPTGCRIMPEIVGECDKKLDGRVKGFILLNTFIVPLFCIVGAVGCIIASLRDVIWREKVFGVRSSRDRAGLKDSVNTSNNGNAALLTNALVGTSPASIDKVESLPTIGKDTNDSDKDHDDMEIRNDRKSGFRADWAGLATDISQTLREPEMIKSRADDSAEVRSSTALDASRLYKRELLVQMICFFAVFCLSALPLIIVNFAALLGAAIPNWAARCCAIFYPLQGFFNILVYTRPKVITLRRKHPSCSRLRALFFTLKAGGDVPDSLDDPCFFCCYISNRRQSPEKEEDDSNPNCPVEGGGNAEKEVISSMPFGVVPRLESSIKSNQAWVGMSLDSSSDRIGQRQVVGRDSEDGESILGSVKRIARSKMEDFSDVDNFLSNNKSGNRDSDMWSAAFDRVRNWPDGNWSDGSKA